MTGYVNAGYSAVGYAASASVDSLYIDIDYVDDDYMDGSVATLQSDPRFVIRLLPRDFVVVKWDD